MHAPTTRSALRLGVALVAVAATAVASPAAWASDGHHGHSKATKVFTLDPSTHGNPEGVAWDDRTDSFFVGTVPDGTIYRGHLGNPSATVFIPGAPGRSATGMKTFKGKLYVAGAGTGAITVYDIATRNVVASFDTGAGGFLNDLVVTGKGDAWVTDSFRPMLWHVTAAQVAAGGGTPEAVPVSPEITFVPGQFNLNGIVSLRHGRSLLVVQSVNGALFRIDLDAPGGRRIRQVDVDPLVGGDGLIIDRGRLVVVQGSPAQLTFVKLSHGSLRGRISAHRTDPTLRGPSTVARAENRYLVVNADFATGTTPFTVSGLAREGDH